MILLLSLAALLPIIILLFIIIRKDKQRPEPAWQIVKAFLLGALSVFISLAVSAPLGALGLYVAEPASVLDSLRLSFFGAAIPEEMAKLLVLWLCLRKNPFFDEKMDGIVYAVCVSLGFAAVENLMYIFTYYNEWVSIGVSRAVFAVPGHFCFGVLMGYYYSLARFYPKSPKKNVALILGAPIIAHGLYDTIAFSQDILPAVSGFIMILFLYFCAKMWKYASRKISEHLQRDGICQ